MLPMKSRKDRLAAFRVVPLALLVATLLESSSAWAAPAGEKWMAVSTTALAITGDVTFSPDRIAFGNGKSLPLAPAGAAPGFDWSGKKTATLYRVTAPADPVLLHGNHLCGQPVTFIAVWKPDLVGSDIDPRSMAAFSGSARPAVAGGPGFCGTYNYEAGGPTPLPATPGRARPSNTR
jgi:hypothetical protein